MAAGHRPCFGVSPFITATLSALTFRPITAEAARATTMIPGAALLGRVFASVDYCSALIFYICLLCLTVGTTLLKPEHCGVVAEFVCPKRRSFLATPRGLSPRATAKGASHHLSVDHPVLRVLCCCSLHPFSLLTLHSSTEYPPVPAMVISHAASCLAVSLAASWR